MQVRLRPKTHHGKNRIAQHGEWWEVELVSISRKLMWLRSLDYTFRMSPVIMSKDFRSIQIMNDEHFEVVEVRQSIEPVEEPYVSRYPMLEKLLQWT